MLLADRAYVVDYLGHPQRVIDDEPLLEWAELNGTPAWQAQLRALEESIVPLRYLKNLWALNIHEQIRLCKSSVLVCGCGGLGGSLITLLARAGVGRLRLVDSDAFVPSNLNRQWLCDTRELSRPKATVAAERIKDINPLLHVEAFVELLSEANAERLVDGVDLVLDALDNLPSRFILAEAARLRGLPFIHAAVAGWWGQLSTFLPDAARDLGQVYGKQRTKDPAEDAIGVLGPTAAIIGSLEALEAIRLLSGRPAAYAGQLLYFDGESGQFQLIPL